MINEIDNMIRQQVQEGIPSDVIASNLIELDIFDACVSEVLDDSIPELCGENCDCRTQCWEPYILDRAERMYKDENL